VAGAELLLDLRSLGSLSYIRDAVSRGLAIECTVMKREMPRRRFPQGYHVPAPGGPIKIMRMRSASQVASSPFMLFSILVILSWSWLTKSLRPVMSATVGAMVNCVVGGTSKGIKKEDKEDRARESVEVLYKKQARREWGRRW
jgi:hypothetical protein